MNEQLTAEISISVAAPPSVVWKAITTPALIKKLEPEKIFQSTYWSSMGGKEDIPENYNLVTYTIEPQGDGTLITILQENIASEKEKGHTTENLKSVLEGLKQVVEMQ